MITLEKLEAFGVDTKKALSRCGDNEALYLRLVKLLCDECLRGDLKEALDNKELGKAFDISHKLKGAISNLSIDPVYDDIYNLTELLRNKSDVDYNSYYNKFIEKINKLNELFN